jgi:hypothetical protein
MKLFNFRNISLDRAAKIAGIVSAIAAAITLPTYFGFFGHSKPEHTAQANSVIGQDIQHSGADIGHEVINSGPGVGESVDVTAPAGMNVTGMRVIQSGLGTGLKVIQNGPGVGLRTTVTITK